MKSNLFESEDSHVLALGTACDHIFGPEWLTWEIRTIRDELRMLGYDIDEMISQKLCAYKVAKTTIGPWVDITIFENVGMVLNDKIGRAHV